MRQKWIESTKKGDSDLSEWVPEEPPFQIEYVWNWFKELHIGRHFGDNGRPKQISYLDIMAWASVTKRNVLPFDVATFRKLDSRFFYVLRTPDASAPQYLNESAIEKQVAATLRALAARPKQDQGLQALETKKMKPLAAIPVPGLSRMAKK